MAAALFGSCYREPHRRVDAMAVDVKTPYLGSAWYPEDWPEEEADNDIRRMKEIGLNVVRIGEFAWHRMEPRPGEFDFSFFHRLCDKAAKAGIGVIMGTPTATPPVWLCKKHPDILAEMDTGRKMSHGGRRHCCSNNPRYIEYSLRIVEKMAREFGQDPAVIGWQCDNEIYMMGGGCFCPECVNGFREHLRAKFGTIDELNRAWNLNLFSQWYDDFSEVPPPRDAWHNPHVNMEWRIFQAESHIRFIRSQAEILHKYTKAPVGTDTMPFNGMDYRDMTEKMDVVQFNHYNTPKSLYGACFWFDYLRTLKDKPFWNTETQTCWNGSVEITQSLKPDGFCRANTWLPVALGGEANLYWLWRTHWAGHELMHGAVIDTSGREMLSTGEVRRTASEFAVAADFINGTRVVPDMAVHFTSLAWNMHESQHVVLGWEYAPTVIDNWYYCAAAHGLRPDVIDAVQAPDKYRLIFTPMLMSLEEKGIGQRMADWVRAGGVWVVGPLTDVRDICGARYRDRYFGMLEALTGIRWKYGIPDKEQRIKAVWKDGTPFEGGTWFEVCENEGGDTLAEITDGHSAICGLGLVTRKKVGKGTVILLGTVPSERDMLRIIGMACEAAGVKPVSTEGKVMVSRREGRAGRGIIAVNIGESPAKIRLPGKMRELLTGKERGGEVALAPFDVAVFKNETDG